MNCKVNMQVSQLKMDKMLYNAENTRDDKMDIVKNVKMV